MKTGEIVQLYLLDLIRKKNSYNEKAFTTPKWILFSIHMIELGYEIYIYAAVTTISKYVYVKNPRNNIQIKIRFSNHKPSYYREINNECDFYVGVSNRKCITTEHIIPQVITCLEGTEKVNEFRDV